MIEFSAKGMSLAFDWEFTESISVGQLDSMKITFNNSENWAPSIEDGKTNIPSGYTEVLKVPPQGKDLLSKEQIK